MFSSVHKCDKNLECNKYLFWGLVAIELFMSFSFLGYVHIAPISLTFVYIPVLVAGCVLGPRESMIIGIIFGMTSMWKASAFYIGAGDAIFSPVMSGKPAASILLSTGARAVFGLLIGLMYRVAKWSRHPLPGIIIVTSIGRSVHTFLVYLFMQIFFPEAGFTVANTLEDGMRADYIPFVLIADVIVVFCYIAVKSDYVKNFFSRIETIDRVNDISPHYKHRLTVMLILVLLASFSVAIYFTNRIRTVMSTYGLDLAEEMSYDLMHLQIQFLFGMIALALLVIIIIILYQKNYNYLYYEAKIDGLTGLLGRQQFFQFGETMLENMSDKSGEGTGFFIILDIDEFKRINDVHGHPAGDAALKKVSAHLQTVFGHMGIIGRLGGDEFVVLTRKGMSEKEIEDTLHNLKEQFGDILGDEEKLTCSIGVIPVEKGDTIEELYQCADRLLYEAKKKGKDQFVLGEHF